MTMRWYKNMFFSSLEQALCYWCLMLLILKEATIDHLVPLVEGGSDYYTNLVICCNDCNQLRGVVQSVLGHAKRLEWLKQRIELGEVPPHMLMKGERSLGKVRQTAMLAQAQFNERCQAGLARHSIQQFPALLCA